MSKSENKHLEKGYRHGRLNVYNPGALFGKSRTEYMRGYKRGMLECERVKVKTK